MSLLQGDYIVKGKVHIHILHIILPATNSARRNKLGKRNRKNVVCTGTAQIPRVGKPEREMDGDRGGGKGNNGTRRVRQRKCEREAGTAGDRVVTGER
jgi:hypothetical protein